MSTVTAGVTTVIVIPPSTSSTSTSTSTSASSAAPSSSGAGLSNNTPEDASTSNQSWIGTHWRWILMIGILLVGLGLVAFLAVCLKRRHRRKLEHERATLSGFPAPPATSRGRTPEPNLSQDLWGPHQHMAHTRGWEYSREQDNALAAGAGAAMFGGAVGKKRSKKVRRRDRDLGEKGKNGSRVDVGEVDASDVVAPRSMSERHGYQEPDWYSGRNVAKNSRSRVERDRGETDAIEKM